MPITLTVLNTLANIIIFLLVLGVVINIHELGHLFFAKRAGILCHEFSFGMGPRLWSKKVGETVYSIRAIPFGGYVSMAGEEIEADILKTGQKVRLGFDASGEVNRIVVNASDPNYHDFVEVKIESYDLSSPAGQRLYINEYTVNRQAMYVMDKKHIQITPKDRSFTHKSKLQRFLVTFGGPLMNFLLAYAVFLIISFTVGVPVDSSPVVGDVGLNTPAAQVIEPGDKIISINGIPVDAWQGDNYSVSSELDTMATSYTIVVERDGQQITLDPIRPQYIFYGLGFTSKVDSDALIIDTPLYRNSELRTGDQLLSINGTAMNTWNDVIDFALAHTGGSTDPNDLYDFSVYRVTTAAVAGQVTKIVTDSANSDYQILTIKGTADGKNHEYRIYKTESIVVSVGDSVDVGTALGSGGDYTISYVIYGAKILDVMGYQPFYSRIGISPTYRFSFFGSFGTAWVSFKSAAISIFKTIYLLFASNLIGVSDLSGFVGIFSLTSQAAAAGVISLLSWVGLLSVNLGILNLLPIPALDGGRIVFIGYEVVTGRKPNQKVENWLHTIMFFLLMGLLVFITYNDILRLIGLK